ncbi:MAG: hypothetical protein ACYTEV_00760 [Planctomycetota bacterium]|jgi:hypothetical protein
MAELEPDAVSWAALLAQCTDYARATAALGDAPEDVRWREATASVVALHAVGFALRQMDRLEEDERPLARDRAAVLVREHVARLDELWRGVPMPESLLQLQDAARTALERAAFFGAVELIWSGPGAFTVPAELAELVSAIEAGREVAAGTLLVMQPGTIAMPGEPVAWWVGRPWPMADGPLDPLEPVDTNVPRQVYRQLDEEGRIVRDVMAPIWCEPVPGMPLLVPLLDEGTPVGRFTMEPGDWERRQRAAMRVDPDAGELPVESVSCDEETSETLLEPGGGPVMLSPERR